MTKAKWCMWVKEVQTLMWRTNDVSGGGMGGYPIPLLVSYLPSRVNPPFPQSPCLSCVNLPTCHVTTRWGRLIGFFLGTEVMETTHDFFNTTTTLALLVSLRVGQPISSTRLIKVFPGNHHVLFCLSFCKILLINFYNSFTNSPCVELTLQSSFFVSLLTLQSQHNSTLPFWCLQALHTDSSFNVKYSWLVSLYA